MKPSHYPNEMRIIIPEDETGSESLSKLSKDWQVVREEDEPGFEKQNKNKNKNPLPPSSPKKLETSATPPDLLTFSQNRALHSVGA